MGLSLGEKLKNHVESAVSGAVRPQRWAIKLRGIYNDALRKTSFSGLNYSCAKVDGGGAISPLSAAHCINSDPVRTLTFVRGLYKAVMDGDGLSRVLEAGSGPFAPIALSVASQFTPEEVQVSAVDFFPDSVKSVRAVADILGLGEHLDGTVEGDLCKDDFSYLRPDIVVCEVMDAALLDEPQGVVTARLARTMRPDTLFIPANITVEALLNNRLKLGTVAQIDDSFREVARTANESDYAGLFEVRRAFKLPRKSKRGDFLTFRTTVHVYGEHVLDRQRAHIVDSIRREIEPHTERVTVSYRMGDANIQLS